MATPTGGEVSALAPMQVWEGAGGGRAASVQGRAAGLVFILLEIKAVWWHNLQIVQLSYTPHRLRCKGAPVESVIHPFSSLPIVSPNRNAGLPSVELDWISLNPDKGNCELVFNWTM
jgi:hypothetical protein